MNEHESSDGEEMCHYTKLTWETKELSLDPLTFFHKSQCNISKWKNFISNLGERSSGHYCTKVSQNIVICYNTINSSHNKEVFLSFQRFLLGVNF